MSDKQKTFPIPEEIMNEILAMHTQIEDNQKQKTFLEQKSSLVRMKMNSLIMEKIPELRGENICIHVEEKTAVVHDNNIAEAFRRVFGMGD